MVLWWWLASRSFFDVYHAGPVFLVVSFLGLLLGLPVSVPGFTVVLGLGDGGCARELVAYLPVKH